MHDIRYNKIAPMMRFVMNDVLYAFHCFRKNDRLLQSMLQVIDGCYLPIELVLLVCMHDIVCVSPKCLTLCSPCGACLSAQS